MYSAASIAREVSQGSRLTAVEARHGQIVEQTREPFAEHREAIACTAFVDTAGRRLSLPVFIVEINAVLPAVASDGAWFTDLGARVGS